MPKGYSGAKVIKILISAFGLFEVSQKGSHVKLNGLRLGKNVVVIVPDHKELAHGTLRSILRQARVEYSEFVEAAQ